MELLNSSVRTSEQGVTYDIEVWSYCVRNGRPVLMGLVKNHSRKNPETGEFEDGHRIYTSDIVRTLKKGEQYITYNGSKVRCVGHQAGDVDWIGLKMGAFGERVSEKDFHRKVVENRKKVNDEKANR